MPDRCRRSGRVDRSVPGWHRGQPPGSRARHSAIRLPGGRGWVAARDGREPGPGCPFPGRVSCRPNPAVASPPGSRPRGWAHPARLSVIWSV